ncbi:MAG: hypothetical protein ACE5DI_04240 [Candidatus Micrarchaeia archaeon]
MTFEEKEAAVKEHLNSDFFHLGHALETKRNIGTALSTDDENMLKRLKTSRKEFEKHFLKISKTFTANREEMLKHLHQKIMQEIYSRKKTTPSLSETPGKQRFRRRVSQSYK